LASVVIAGRLVPSGVGDTERVSVIGVPTGSNARVTTSFTLPITVVQLTAKLSSSSAVTLLLDADNSESLTVNTPSLTALPLLSNVSPRTVGFEPLNPASFQVTTKPSLLSPVTL
jgi:hypothetical protein